MIIWKKKLIECCKCHKRYSFDDNLFYHLKEYILVCPNCNLMHKVDIQLLGKEYEGLKKVNKINLTAIDIGSAATVRTANLTNNYTWVDKNNSANATGKITKLAFYTSAGLDGVEVATFYVVSGNNLSTRDTQSIGKVGGGYQEVAVDLDVNIGDWIGVTYTSGYLRQTGAFGAYWYVAGDKIPCTNQVFTLGSTTFSLYGTGATLGWPHKWNGVTIGKLNGAVISKWNGVA